MYSAYVYEVALLELETRARRTGRETSDCSICLLSFEFNRFTTGAPVLARCRQVTSVCKGATGGEGVNICGHDSRDRRRRACAGKALERFDVAGAVFCKLSKPRRENSCETLK